MDRDPEHSDEKPNDIPRCCCGRPDCAFRAHSCRLLEEVKRDARTAGELGQALLARHEAYVSDAEQDRKRMLSKMEELEQDKRHLENRNMETVEENRKLLDQLEALNLAVDNSDTQVHSLTEKLHATEQHLERINGLATRSEGLQRQLSRLEEEEARLHANLDTTKENERAAVLRWQQAERTIVSLHLQIEQLEHEAKKEHDRVEEEILAGRKHALAAELQRPGQLDPTSSAKTLPQVKSGNNVISHFVKDILTDNANLQLSVVELRGLLQKSNEQVEQLRDQLTQHAPPEDPSPHSPTPTLGVELGVGTKEFHVHHHYHAPLHAAESSKTPKSQIRRRTRNTRVRHASDQFTPISIASSPRSSISQRRPSSPTPAGTILSPSAVTIPRQKARRSMQSHHTGFTSSSSLPSSPSGGSIFDRAFNDTAATTDISRPTSPESAGGFSPRGTAASHFDLMDRKRRLSSQRANHIDLANPSAKEDGREQYPGTPTSNAIPLSSKRNSALSNLDIASPRHSTILEETEDAGRILTLDTDHHDFLASPSEYSSEPQLKRVASHESIFSVSGMDIHTIANRPTQRLISNRVISAPILNSPTPTSTALSDASATAVRPSLYRKRTAANSDSFSRAYLSGVAASHITNQPAVKKKPSMSRMVLGWWTWAAVAEDTDPPTQASLAAAEAGSVSSGPAAKSVDSVESELRTMTATHKPRPPGVNQVGPIFGFGPEPATPFKARPGIGEVDEEALRDSLRENG